MSRPPKKRIVSFDPEVTLFIPSGVPRCRMETVIFGTDEIEALRLTDLEGMYQGQAADAMGISRQTLGNILCSARRKASEALTQGKAIRIAAGSNHEGSCFHLDSPGVCTRKPGDGCLQNSGSGCNQPEGSGGNSQSANDCGRRPGAGCGHGAENGCRN